METLRTEIIESQKARNDLMKWKLLLVSGLGAAGLGFSEHSGTFRAELVLCCIPFVCAYVDLVCNHLSLRIRVIGKFISSTVIEDNTITCIKAYEKFVDAKIRGSGIPGNGEIGAFDLENWALIGSSILLSLGLVGYAFWIGLQAGSPFMLSGILGILASIIIQQSAAARRKKIESITIDPSSAGRDEETHG